MSILIKGMEMPKEFDPDVYIELACGTDGERYARLYNFHQGGLTEWCEVVPVPPHGDLIERDDLRASIRESVEECHKWADEVDKDTMMYARISQSIGTFVECSLRAKAAPTIIEAEEGE